MSKVVLEHVPVLYPTEDEFKDPIEYLSQPGIQRMGHIYGMMKLVPPKIFAPPMSINEERFRFQVRLQTLSELGILNRSRLFFVKQVNNFLKVQGKEGRLQLSKPYHLADDGKKLYYYDLFIEVLKFFNGRNSKRSSGSRKRRIDSLAGDEGSPLTMIPLQEVLSSTQLWKHISKVLEVPSETLIYVFRNKISKYYQYLQKQSVKNPGSSFATLIYSDEFPKSLIQDDSEDDGDEEEEDEDEDEETCVICQRDGSSVDMIWCDSCGNSFHAKCVQPSSSSSMRESWVCSNCIIGTGYYGFKEEDYEYSKAEFQQKCAEFDSLSFPKGKPIHYIPALEAMFWDLVDNIDNRLTIRYGADIHHQNPGEVTGFPTMEWIPPHIEKDTPEYKRYLAYTTHPMNLVNLPNAKGSLLPVFGRSISGMTVPWIYIGSTFSTFCWHLEDQYTLSANYQHEGDPKIWYSIPEQCANAFNRLMRNISPDLFEKQPDLMHQLVTLISPYDKQFQNAGISCYKAVQRPGEYILTYPKCYHAGFNSGYNFNEAVNFTLDLWIPYGLRAIDDYKLTGKKCVFDMWELMLNILIQYLSGTSKFQEALVRRCHAEVLKMFNTEMKIVQRLEGILHDNGGQASLIKDEKNTKLRGVFPKLENDIYMRQDTDDENSDDDQDLFCAKCKTICSFAFVAHSKKTTNGKRRKFSKLNRSEWNKLSSLGSISVLCLSDYMEMVEQVRDHAVKRRSSTALEKGTDIEVFRNDELYYMREPDDVREILQHAEKKIDSYL